jgi:hypothetical protein
MFSRVIKCSMTTPPNPSIHWIAGTGLVTPVVILESGTGGQELAYVPPDPVVVRSVSDYFEFVASESALFTDRGLAMKEAHRLRDEEVAQAKRLLAQIERREAMAGSLYPFDPKILQDKDASTTQPVVDTLESSNTQEVPVKIEVSSTTPQTQEVVVVAKKSTPEKSDNPTTLLERILYVVGRETLSFDEICQRLTARGWFPKRRGSVSNVLSGHKNLFHCPTKSSYSLRNKPKVSLVEHDAVTLHKSREAEQPTSEPEEDQDTLETVSLEGSDEGEPDDGASDTVEESPEEDEPASEFDTWMGMPMTSLSPKRAHYHDEGVVLAEKINGDGKWTAEIHVTGLALWSEGSSDDRGEARSLAQAKLNEQADSVESTLERLKM